MVQVGVAPPDLELVEPWHPTTELAKAALQNPNEWVRCRWPGQTRKMLGGQKPRVERTLAQLMIANGIVGEIETRTGRDADKVPWLYARVTLA